MSGLKSARTELEKTNVEDTKDPLLGSVRRNSRRGAHSFYSGFVCGSTARIFHGPMVTLHKWVRRDDENAFDEFANDVVKLLLYVDSFLREDQKSQSSTPAAKL